MAEENFNIPSEREMTSYDMVPKVFIRNGEYNPDEWED